MLDTETARTRGTTCYKINLGTNTKPAPKTLLPEQREIHATKNGSSFEPKNLIRNQSRRLENRQSAENEPNRRSRLSIGNDRNLPNLDLSAERAENTSPARNSAQERAAISVHLAN